MVRTILAIIVASMATLGLAFLSSPARAADETALADLGRKLFFDPALSASGELACATCHDPHYAYGPPPRKAIATGGPQMNLTGTRAVPSLRYLERAPPFTESMLLHDGGRGPAGGLTWDGRAASLHEQARIPLLAPNEMANASPAAVIVKLKTGPYAAQLRRLFGADIFARPDRAFEGVLLALEAFQRIPSEFYPYTSKYDAYLRGETDLSAQEKRGLEVFNHPGRGNCANCHLSNSANGAPPPFTDFEFDNIGAPRNPHLAANRDPAYFDMGLCGPSRTDLAARHEYCGLFRTPTLRNVALRDAYFHNAVFASLREVLQFYQDAGYDALALVPQESERHRRYRQRSTSALATYPQHRPAFHGTRGRPSGRHQRPGYRRSDCLPRNADGWLPADRNDDRLERRALNRNQAPCRGTRHAESEALHLRGLREARAGRPASAAIWFDRALDVDPLNASAHLDRGVILRNLGRLPDALASFERALALDPHLTAAHANRGVLLKELRQWDAALASLDSAIAQNPHMGSAHANRAAVLLELGRWRAALASCDEALRIAPHQAQAHCNRGSALRALGCLSESLASYDAAIHLDAGLAEAYSNRGAVLADLHEWEQARESYDAAIALRPDFAEARFNRSVIALLRGEFSGWMDYEWRWLNENGKTCRERRDFAQPAWRGKEPLAGRTILLFAEQGLGDTLQFCRYVPLVAALGATVILEVQKPLVKLLRGLPGISYAIARGEPLPAFDCHCPLLSLPLAFGTQLDTVPAAACYLEPDAALIAEWTKRLGDSGQAAHRACVER